MRAISVWRFFRQLPNRNSEALAVTGFFARLLQSVPRCPCLIRCEVDGLWLLAPLVHQPDARVGGVHPETGFDGSQCVVVTHAACGTSKTL